MKKTLSRLMPLCLTALLAACATPGPQQIDDGSKRGASAERIDWSGLRLRLAAGVATDPGIELGEREAGSLQVRVPVADGFAPGKAEVRPALQRRLDILATALAAEREVAVLVVGHTDSQGSEMYNLQLSIARAEAVAEQLRGRGVALERLAADGRGEAEPIADNGSEAGRAQNRRIELLLRAMP
ncbi:MAG: OmpA family protein [Thauera phenolivorans]|uniref:OmpA family protein n=1 Tax=Thauera phenolivorans TaxID=1792543 RepID=A0A7X7LTR2_9RHOO|nr:OmpA family protein [Thauera phenolivorans]NLF53153.1 OmpA family protein [Thauera phenolivorans]